MIDPARLDATRKAFADVTARLEDAAHVASEGQAVQDRVEACKICDQLIEQMNAMIQRLHRLQRRLR